MTNPIRPAGPPPLFSGAAAATDPVRATSARAQVLRGTVPAATAAQQASAAHAEKLLTSLPKGLLRRSATAPAAALASARNATAQARQTTPDAARSIRSDEDSTS